MSFDLLTQNFNSMFEDVIEMSSYFCDKDCDDVFASNQDYEKDYEYAINRVAARNTDGFDKEEHGNVSLNGIYRDVGEGLDHIDSEKDDQAIGRAEESIGERGEYDFSNNSLTFPPKQHEETPVIDYVLRNKGPGTTYNTTVNNTNARHETPSADDSSIAKHTHIEAVYFGGSKEAIYQRKPSHYDHAEGKKTNTEVDMLDYNRVRKYKTFPEKYACNNRETRLSNISADNSTHASRKVRDTTFTDDHLRGRIKAINTTVASNNLLENNKESAHSKTTPDYSKKKHQTKNKDTFRKLKDNGNHNTGADHADIVRLPAVVNDTIQSNNKGRQSHDTQPVKSILVDNKHTFPIVCPTPGSIPRKESKLPHQNKSLTSSYKPNKVNNKSWLNMSQLPGKGSNNVKNPFSDNFRSQDPNFNPNNSMAVPELNLTYKDFRRRVTIAPRSPDRSSFNYDLQKQRALNIREKLATPKPAVLPKIVNDLIHSNDNKLAFLPGLPGKRTGTNALNMHAKYTGSRGDHLRRYTSFSEDAIQQSFGDISEADGLPMFKKFSQIYRNTKEDETPQITPDETDSFSVDFNDYKVYFKVREMVIEDRPYLKTRYLRAKEMIRFELPFDISSLEGKTPLFYLAKYTRLDKEIKDSFTRTFERFKGPKRNSTTVKEQSIYSAISSMFGNDLLYQNYELIDECILQPERDTQADRKIKLGLKELMGLCAFCERRFWSEVFPMNDFNAVGCCTPLEYLDFRTLDKKLLQHYEKFSPALITVLKSLV